MLQFVLCFEELEQPLARQFLPARHDAPVDTSCMARLLPLPCRVS
ncbi:hypothetical protein [Pantoea sp. 18069]|nr:hypothetical protein [Pantoea sp. 18069]